MKKPKYLLTMLAALAVITTVHITADAKEYNAGSDE